MFQYTIIGLESVSYVNKAGQQVSGVRLHLSYEKKNCVGLAVETVFTSAEVAAGVEVGSVIELLYNKYGKVVQVAIFG